jgi:thioredoxin reductase (NADPH)
VVSRQRPVIVAVDVGAPARTRAVAELARRYHDDYEVVEQADPDGAAALLRSLHDTGTPVALVLAAAGPTRGAELLALAGRLHPASKRALLIDFAAWGDPAIADEVRTAIAQGHADYYVLKPWRHGDELFHRTVSEFLHEYARSNTAAELREFAVVAHPWSARGHELRRLLARNGIPHVFYEAGSAEARAILADGGRSGLTAEEAPIVRTARGDLLVDPSDAELAHHYGVTTVLTARDFDLVVIGAGPSGLAASISAAADGLSVLVIERESIGGQANMSTRIRNYPGFSRGVTGAELAQRAYQQAWAFGVEFLHMREVTGLEPAAGRWSIRIADEADATAAAVLLAMGVAYRRVDAPTLDSLIGRGVSYGASLADARAFAGKDVVVVGGGNSAGQAAVHLARWASHVTIATRGPELSRTMSHYLRREIDTLPNVAVQCGATLVDGGGDGHLEWLLFHDAAGAERRVAADAVFLFLGGVPRTSWLPNEVARDGAGYVLTGTDVPAATAPGGQGGGPAMFETSAPGVYAVGDVRAGSVKRVASAVGEGSVVVPWIVRHIERVASARGVRS